MAALVMMLALAASPSAAICAPLFASEKTPVRNDDGRPKKVFGLPPPAPAFGRHVDLPKGPLSSVRLTLSRSDCWGGCPSYNVTVTGAGHVRFDGFQHVVAPGRHYARVPPEQVACLVDAFARADFWSLRRHFEAHISDQPLYRLRLRIGGRTKTVDDYAGQWDGMPDIATDLEDGMDRLATRPWVQGDDTTVARLKGEGFNFHSRFGAQALISALKQSSDTVVVELIRAGAMPLKRSRSPLSYAPESPSEMLNAAASRKSTTALELMLQQKIYSDPKIQQIALLTAARYGRLENIKLLIDQHVDVNFVEPGEDGDGPALAVISVPPEEIDNVDISAREGKISAKEVAIARLLLDAGADPNRRNGRGETPLHHAGYVDVARILVAAGADVNARDQDGRTPLSQADSDDLARFLVEAGADVNAKDQHGLTPLSYALFDDLARFLLEAGANPHTPHREGGTIIEAAHRRNWPRTLEWLRAHGEVQ